MPILSGAQALVGEQKVVISDSGNAREELKQGHMAMPEVVLDGS